MVVWERLLSAPVDTRAFYLPIPLTEKLPATKANAFWNETTLRRMTYYGWCSEVWGAAAVSIRLTLSVNSFSSFLYHRHYWRKEVCLSKIQLLKGIVNKFVNKHIVEKCYKNSDPQVYFSKCLVNCFETFKASARHDKCKWGKCMTHYYEQRA
jgi:hypothetical protein